MAITMKKVEALMHERGLKKYDLRKMGFNPHIVDKVLSGPLNREKRVDTETINRLCEVFGCQPGDIMEYVPDPPECDEQPGGGPPENNRE